MIIKGKSRGNGAQLGRYLVTRGENEIIRVVEIRGVAAADVPGAVLEMDALAAGARTRKGLYHAHINTPVDERLIDEQRAYAVDRLEAALGLSGQPRVVVVHEKKGREHCHIVWSRVSLDRMAAISDSYNYQKHEEVARELERAFGLRRVRGAYAERDGGKGPSPAQDEVEPGRAARSGLSAQQVKAEITGLWRSSSSPAELLQKRCGRQVTSLRAATVATSFLSIQRARRTVSRAELKALAQRMFAPAWPISIQANCRLLPRPGQYIERARLAAATVPLFRRKMGCAQSGERLRRPAVPGVEKFDAPPKIWRCCRGHISPG